MLNIKGLTERGESFYNPFLNEVVEDLEAKSLAVPSEGATVVFLEGVSKISFFPNKNLTLIVAARFSCSLLLFYNSTKIEMEARCQC